MFRGAKKKRFVLGKRTFRSQKSKHFVLRIIGVMNGLFYLDEIFYSENSPYLYGIDTLSSINQSKPIRTMEHYVNIMLDSGFKAALYDEREVMQFLLYLPYDLPSRREGPGVEIRPAPGIWNLPFELQPSRVPFMANGRGSGK